MPEREQADNDYAVGWLTEKGVKSCYASDTLIFRIEDDSQDGRDHVDANRKTAYVVHPHVRHGRWSRNLHHGFHGSTIECSRGC
jgi:hypothetical protein